MISRYTHPEMGRIWSDSRRYETWLQVEVAAADAMAAAGIVPADAARDIRERGSFEIGRDVERVRRARETISVGKLSGAVGTFAHLPPQIEQDVCSRLGLQPEPVASQIVQRDRHAELVATLAVTAASLEKFALEIRG